MQLQTAFLPFCSFSELIFERLGLGISLIGDKSIKSYNYSHCTLRYSLAQKHNDQTKICNMTVRFTLIRCTANVKSSLFYQYAK